MHRGNSVYIDVNGNSSDIKDNIADDIERKVTSDVFDIILSIILYDIDDNVKLNIWHSIDAYIEESFRK